MPELPEVETVFRGLAPHLIGQTIKHVVVRQKKLRWPIPTKLSSMLNNQDIKDCARRAKYFLMQFADGTVLIHLGMSGRLYLTTHDKKPEKHDHVDFILANGQVLRFTDPRRFGCIIWITDLHNHKLLNQLGPEPLSRDFSTQYLFKRTRNKIVSIKSFIMNQHHVVGVGNIYASESLFKAGIHPERQACSLTELESDKLVKSIKTVLKKAIKAGGTTLRDFVNGESKPGYFKQSLAVYGRANQACPVCHHPIKICRQNQRSTFFCDQCQS